MDLTCSLQESVAGEWNGDVDLGNGKLQLLRSEYTKRLEAAPKLHDLVSIARIHQLVKSIEQDLDNIYECKLLKPCSTKYLVFLFF